MEDTAQMRCTLDDGSVVTLMWLGNGSLAVQRYKSGNARDGHGWLLTESGTVDPETVAAFLYACMPPPPRAA